MEKRPLVSIIIVTYNNEKDIVECIDSILDQKYKNFEIIIVDNASSDSTVPMIKERYATNPFFKLIQNNENEWYAGGNNIGFQHSNGELIAILNPDTTVTDTWLEELLKTYQENIDDAGIVCSNVLLFAQREVINACGNDIHLTGMVFSRFYMEHKCKCIDSSTTVAAPSGAAMLFPKMRLKQIERTVPFDTTRFLMEYSDIDLAMDMLGHGFRCYVASNSIVFHKYKFKMTPDRLYSLETGRYKIFRHLTRTTQIHLLMPLFLAEVIVIGFILLKRRDLTISKLKTWYWSIRHIGSLQTAKSIRNSFRKDSAILSAMTPNLFIYKEISSEQDVNRSFLIPRANSYFKGVKDKLLTKLSFKE